ATEGSCRAALEPFPRKIPRSARDDRPRATNSMPTYPPTRTSETVDELHGEAIPDPYRWLEDGDSPETQEWTRQQNALTERYLGAWPGREKVRRRLDQLLAIGALGVPTP